MNKRAVSMIITNTVACVVVALYDPGEPRDFHGRWTDGDSNGSGSLNDTLEDLTGGDPEPTLKQYGATNIKQIDLQGRKVWAYSHDGQRWVWEDGDAPVEASTFVFDNDPEELLPERDFSKEFWHDVGEKSVLYHATPEHNFDSIKKSGLHPREETRGIGNRGTGAAVFTSSNLNSIESYGVPIGIDLHAMKRDGYTPRVSQEGPIAEYDARQALASKLGIDDFGQDEEPGIDPDTVIVYGNIPAKYLKFPAK